MSKKYPHGCDVDYLNEQVAEAMHAAHCEEHEAYPQKGCEWCEAEEQAEREAELVQVKCPICRQLNAKGMYCTGCGWVPPREGN